MNFRLYDYVLSGNCYKVRLMASLLGIDYETVAVDFYPGREHRSEKMLALNPAGTLPVLTAGDMVLTETQAMLVWMAARFDKGGTWYPSETPDAQAEVSEWLAFSGRLTRSAGAARLGAMLGWPVDMQATRVAAVEDLRALELRLTDRRFAGGHWLVGDHPTIADIACFPYVALSPDAGLEHDPYPAIANWLYQIRGLKGFVAMPGIHYRHDLKEHADA